jgi:ATP-dependent Lon protease
MATETKTEKTKAEKKTKKSEPIVIPVLPLRGIVPFPGMMLPLFVGREKSVAALQAASENKENTRTILLVAQRDENVEEPEPKDLYEFGIMGEVMQMLKMPDGNVRAVIEARGRCAVKEYSPLEAPFLAAAVEAVKEKRAPSKSDTNAEALQRRLKTDFETAVNLSKKIPPEVLQSAQSVDKLAPLSDLIISYLDSSVEERQKGLEMTSPLERANFAIELLGRELQILELDKELDMQVREGMNENQREYFLRERMKAIQDKLGERDSSFREADELRAKVEAAEMSEEAKDKALSEIARMEKMPPIAPEVGIIRSYVELMCDLPWNKRTEDNLDLKRAQEVLDEDHYALEKIKDRIVEFLAVRKLNPESRGPILCFMGPPGVGKTSIGKSIARALGREFIRVSVGGVHDEAEIRGHRRTYIGSMPGRLISAIRRAKTKNPVFVLDEIDKLGNDFRGDPSSALLEALDPEQNSTFTDHYLEVPFDLSEVMFIATGNLLDPIQPALRDRFEVLRFAGYTEAEKHAIARRYLVPKQIKENGLTDARIEYSDEGITQIIRQYTREAGVRNLEREIGTIARKVARRVAESSEFNVSSSESEKGTQATRNPEPGTRNPVVITPENLKEFLGARKFTYDPAQEADEVGVAQGLAYTEMGGEVMPIEVSLVDGKGATKLTGNLGNVMKESAEAAMTYARSHATELGINGDWTKKHDAHIHVPAGAVPKDGPSAGVAMSVALISALTNRPVRKEIAMTGEISLRGRVMPIGGVKEKVLAAHRAGLHEVLLPSENERDLDDIPAEVQKGLKFHWVDKLDEAVKVCLVATRSSNRTKRRKSNS